MNHYVVEEASKILVLLAYLGVIFTHYLPILMVFRCFLPFSTLLQTGEYDFQRSPRSPMPLIGITIDARTESAAPKIFPRVDRHNPAARPQIRGLGIPL